MPTDDEQRAQYDAGAAARAIWQPGTPPPKPAGLDPVADRVLFAAFARGFTGAGSRPAPPPPTD